MSSVGKEHVGDGLLLRAMDEELAPPQALRVQRHIEQCADCRERFERLQGVTSRVVEYHREAIESDPALAESERQEFMGRLEQAGAEAPRPVLARLGWARWQAQPALWRRAAWCGALSLLIVAGLVVGTWRPRSPISNTVRPLVVGPRPRAEVSPAPKQPAEVVTAKAVRPVRRALKKRGTILAAAATNLPEKAVPQEVARERVAAEEIATPFFSLPFSDASLPLDQAAMIRVELPRSALSLTGMPVPEDRRNERVRADLIMGADGLARAIRFVR